jgi:hypothetical protein
MGTANSAGSDDTRFRSETYQNVSFESAFSNDNRFSPRQINRLEGEVNWRAGTRASEWKRACEPSVVLFADAKIVSVKPELSGLDAALVVTVGDDEQWHIVITRIPELKLASFVLPKSGNTDYGRVLAPDCILGEPDLEELIQCKSQNGSFLVSARKSPVILCFRFI